MTIRTAVIGSGNAARLHLAAARAAAPALDIVAIGARNRESAAVLAAAPGAALMSPEEAATSRDIDAVILAVPASAQPALAIAAFASGKHVLCEKPLAATLADARAIESAWRVAGTVGMVNFCYRLIPAITEFRDKLDAGICGDIAWIEAQWVLSSRIDPSLPFNWKADAAAGGGALRNFGSHIVDYLFHGREVSVASAWVNTLTPARRDSGGVERAVSADETMTAVLKTPGWPPVIVHVSLTTRPQLGHRLTARGSAGTLEAWNTSASSPAGPFRCSFSGSVIENALIDHAGASLDFSTLFEPVLSRFANAIGGGADAAPSIGDGVRAAELVDAIASAARA